MREYSQEELCRLWLQWAPGLTWQLRQALLEHFGGAESVYRAPDAVLREALGERLAEELVQLRAGGLTRLVERLHSCGADAVFPDSPDYPERLRDIADPPQALFYRGTPQKDHWSVAIIGSRYDTRYGRSQAFSIARDLARQGVTIVSGLARGIDSVAHEGALAAGGRTVGILGCGIDRMYPAENEALARKIIENGGAVMTEFAPGEKPLGFHFPIRNRIISGISAAVLVVEGSRRSGTLNTAGHAGEQGREVFALPGMVDAPGSEAPLMLLRDGAVLCTCAQDILDDLRWSARAAAPEPAPEEAPTPLSDVQRLIVRQMAREPKRFEELAEETHLPPDTLTGELTMLELNGVIEPRAGRAYALKRKP